MKIQEEAELTSTEDICKTSLPSSKYFRNPILRRGNSPWSSMLYSYLLPEKKDQIPSVVCEILPVCHAVLLPNSKI